MKMLLLLVLTVFMFLPLQSYSRDVYVHGYYRKDGTYVRPHVRSSPNSYKWDNYGPSRSDSELMNPTVRDNDSDGTPNYLDRDDDNDGFSDDADENQYNR